MRVASQHEDQEQELSDPKLQADTRDLDIGCAGCLTVFGIILLAIVFFLLISPGRGHFRYFQGPGTLK